VIFHPQTLWI
jgi:hypothetical protein